MDGGPAVTSSVLDPPRVVDQRAVGALPQASTELADLWAQAAGVAAAGLPVMGLSAGERPVADVEVLAGLFAVVEYEVARRMHAATMAGAMPLVGPGAVLAARGWAGPHARRLARAGALAADHPPLAEAWAAGLVTADHVDAVARHAEVFTAAELAVVVGELAEYLGRWSPAMIARFVAAAARMLHPPADPTPDESDAYTSRDLSFAVLGDTVILSGALPRVDGEAVIAAIDGLAERLRSTADHIPAGARRADALVELVNTAASAGALPTRGGLPVALTVTLDHTDVGDPVWSTSRGHELTPAEVRFVGCDPTITPILVDHTGGQPCADNPAEALVVGHPTTPSQRIAALARLMFDGPRLPLAVGRTSRTATAAQRRALATRDGGCVIPGCGVAAETCQAHHLTDWADGSNTDLDNLVLLCWAHHRQVDLRMWTIEPRGPGSPPDSPEPAAPPGTPWPANNGAPWIIRATPRTRWRP